MKQRHHAAGYVYQPRKSDDPTRVQWLIAKQLCRIAKRRIQQAAVRKANTGVTP